jgi:hypothetical protein
MLSFWYRGTNHDEIDVIMMTIIRLDPGYVFISNGTIVIVINELKFHNCNKLLFSFS